jgi:hypothetical protein
MKRVPSRRATVSSASTTEDERIVADRRRVGIGDLVPAPKKPKPPVGFNSPKDGPDLVKAAAVALGVARHCRAESWADLVDRLESGDTDTLILLAGLYLTAEQSRLIEEADGNGILRLLRVKPGVTVAVCPECNQWVLVVGTPPTKCKVTLRCVGKPVKASIASKRPLEPHEVEDTLRDLDEDDFDDIIFVPVEEPAVEMAEPEHEHLLDDGVPVMELADNDLIPDGQPLNEPGVLDLGDFDFDNDVLVVAAPSTSPSDFVDPDDLVDFDF